MQIDFKFYNYIYTMGIAEKYMPHYTYEDYCLWEGKWELIEGIPYAMSPAPVPQHQRVNGNLFSVFKEALNKSCNKCKVYLPIDWKIAEDTTVQPDLLIVCKPIEKKYLDFTPALLVEILSPSSAINDRGLKFEIYESQKVKYYLIVDPQFKKIEVYELINNKYEPVAVNPSNYNFLLEENCTINTAFEDIWE
jgi:Uma2 family endonuclease